jgi:hypothetical protein
VFFENTQHSPFTPTLAKYYFQPHEVAIPNLHSLFRWALPIAKKWRPFGACMDFYGKAIKKETAVTRTAVRSDCNVYPDYPFFTSFAQASFNPTVRLKISLLSVLSLSAQK